jgi:hypothetical protein
MRGEKYHDPLVPSSVEMTRRTWGLVGCALAFGACAQGAAGPSAAPQGAAAKAADTPDGVAAIKSLCGLLLVANDGDAHFAVDLAGTSVRVEEKAQDVFYVDDLQVQVVRTSAKQIGAAAADKGGLDLLRAHEAWESEYLGQQLGAKLEPQEVNLEAGKGASFPGPGLMWWVELPPNSPVGHGFWVYATFELEGRVVGLSARATGGLQPVDIMSRLATWLGGMRTSTSSLDPRVLSEDIRRRNQAGEVCRTKPTDTPTLGVDRRLRLDDVKPDEQDGLAQIAAGEGGVERSVVDGRRRYLNHICRFAFDYPAGWDDFWIQDFSEKGCRLNLTTPLTVDRDDGEKITNAVYIWGTKAQPDFGPEQFQDILLGPIKEQGARVKTAPKPALAGAIGATYELDAKGTHFVGELLTIQRGPMVYAIHFNATRGTVAVGRKHFLRWLDGLKLDVP